MTSLSNAGREQIRFSGDEDETIVEAAQRLGRDPVHLMKERTVAAAVAMDMVPAQTWINLIKHHDEEAMKKLGLLD